MSLTRAFEEHEVGPDLRRIYQEARTALDLPFTPTLFKVAAGVPDYLKLMWADLGPVARSKEFHAAAKALGEVVRSDAVRGGWRFSDQTRALSGERFSRPDIQVLAEVPPIFTRTLCQMAIFSRLMQRGYSGGQRGRVSTSKQAAAMSRLFRLQIPNEKDAGLRTWLIYSDIKRTTGSKHVMSLFRLLSHFPGYLAATWVEAKKVMSERDFQRTKDDVARRTLGLLNGLPVRDHRAAAGRRLSHGEWRDIEETVDAFARVTPLFALMSAVWQRSFPEYDVHKAA
jgi:hypothetical protein